MSEWLNTVDTTLEMIIQHLPSPKSAMKYRAEYLYEGPNKDDEICTSMKNCDSKGPLMVYVSKFILIHKNSSNNELYAVGRIFSGSIS